MYHEKYNLKDALNISLRYFCSNFNIGKQHCDPLIWAIFRILWLWCKRHILPLIKCNFIT